MCKTLKECLEYKKVIIYISYYFAGKKKTKAQKLNNKPKDIQLIWEKDKKLNLKAQALSTIQFLGEASMGLGSKYATTGSIAGHIATPTIQRLDYEGKQTQTINQKVDVRRLVFNKNSLGVGRI